MFHMSTLQPLSVTPSTTGVNTEKKLTNDTLLKILCILHQLFQPLHLSYGQAVLLSWDINLVQHQDTGQRWWGTDFPRFSPFKSSSNSGIYCLLGSITIPASVRTSVLFKVLTFPFVIHTVRLFTLHSEVLDSSVSNQLQSSFEPTTNTSSTCTVTHLHFVLRLYTVPSKGMKSNWLNVDSKCSCKFDAVFLCPGKGRRSFPKLMPLDRISSVFAQLGILTRKKSFWGTVKNASLTSITKTLCCCTKAKTKNRWMIHLLKWVRKFVYLHLLWNFGAPTLPVSSLLFFEPPVKYQPCIKCHLIAI